MSSVKNETLGVSAAGIALNPLFRSLMSGLHAAAQPLTVLRVRLDEDYIQSLEIEDLRRIAIEAIGPVDRLCSLVSSMQQLVTAEYLQPQPSEINVLALLRGTVEGLELLFAEKGIDLVSEVPAESVMMVVDGKRLEEAIATSLLLVQGISHPGDRIVVSGSCQQGAFRCAIRNGLRTVDKLSSDHQLLMAIAEADVRTQAGTLELSLAPLVVELSLGD
jgi:hypothetical protein